MERDYNELRGKIRHALDRTSSPGARRSGLFKIFPKTEQSKILKWEEESLSPSEIALRFVSEKYNCTPPTLRRLLSQAKKLTPEERGRRQWLQQFNVSDPASPAVLDRVPDYFLSRLLPLTPKFRDEIQLPTSSIPSSLLYK